ncbi:FISUMP domain-containing protein [Chitinophaga sp. 22620]|uniref:FISUMP domain-containing protein n=1 Tax=Chitinophaga sp. 22620 TaxID=3453952 RepID=UPI003F86C059
MRPGLITGLIFIPVNWNGDTIPHARSAEEWERAGREGRPAWSYYRGDTGEVRSYGRMYNWFAVNDARGLAPVGWHVATNDFTGMGEFTYMASATEADLKDSRNDQMAVWGRGAHIDNKTVMRCALDKHFGLYVRCVRDIDR